MILTYNNLVTVREYKRCKNTYVGYVFDVFNIGHLDLIGC